MFLKMNVLHRYPITRKKDKNCIKLKNIYGGA